MEQYIRCPICKSVSIRLKVVGILSRSVAAECCIYCGYNLWFYYTYWAYKDIGDGPPTYSTSASPSPAADKDTPTEQPEPKETGLYHFTCQLLDNSAVTEMDFTTTNAAYEKLEEMGYELRQNKTAYSITITHPDGYSFTTIENGFDGKIWEDPNAVPPSIAPEEDDSG